MFKRILALTLIFICSWVGWAILSVVMHLRTDEKSDTMAAAVGQLWGSEHVQLAPQINIQWKQVTREPMTEQEKREYIEEKQKKSNLEAIRLGIKPTKVIVHDRELIKVKEESFSRDLALTSSEVHSDLDLDYRKKGLLWFSTYTVDFRAQYTFENPVDRPVAARVTFDFPSHHAVYDDMTMTVPDRDDLQIATEAGQMVGVFVLPARATQTLTFGYESRGLDRWTYRFGRNVDMVKNFHLAMNTNFTAIDFPNGTISPDDKQPRTDGPGWTLTWDKKSLVSGQEIGMLMPHKLNPGPLAAGMSMHAPISLFFFFFVMFILQVLREIKMHPMNYFFLATSFFAFNLLFSYLVDHVDIVMAFGISAVVSLFLVVSYMKLVVGARFALIEVGLSQIIYQLLFSLAHFFEGYTGLTITIGAILTLAVVMRLTARIDWAKVFGGGGKTAPQVPVESARLS